MANRPEPSLSLVRCAIYRGAGGLRVPAHDLETGVWGRLRAFLSTPTELLNALGDVGGRQLQVLGAGTKVVSDWETWPASVRREWLRSVLQRVVVSPTKLILELRPKALVSRLGLAEVLPMAEGEPIALESESRLKWGGRGLRFVIPGPLEDWQVTQRDQPLVHAVARGRHWYDLLVTGQARSREEIARAQGISSQHVARHLPLAWLAPDIVEAILEGRQPKALSVRRLMGGFPMDWAEQRKVLGFETRA